MILLIDNYDSFIFNLAHAVRELGDAVQVVRNDAIEIEGITAEQFEAVILGPGPGTPEQAGICLPLLQSPNFDLPTLGVCLGHQAIAAANDARISRTRPVHGRASSIRHDDSLLFAGIPNPFLAARYHSLAVEAPLSPLLRVTARARNVVMALEHTSKPFYGVQFHPESILTEQGGQLLANFLRISRIDRKPSLVETAQSH